MRTLAASMSAPHWSYVDVLYAESRLLLEESRQASSATDARLLTPPYDTIKNEYIQAWLLLAYYESLRVNERQAMLTAGYAFRLVQLTRLHELDKPSQIAGAPPAGGVEATETFAEMEERRRTFWVAYTLDYFQCWRKEWPLTLNEDMINTRLPAPEANFQNSQPIVTNYLADALAKGEPEISSLFSECIVLTTLHSRCRIHHRRTSSRQADVDSHHEPPRNTRLYHEALIVAVEKHVKALEQGPTMPTVERDPMLFFIHMLAHSAIICLGSGGAVSHPGWDSESGHVYKNRATRAMAEMLRLVKMVPSFSSFKSHPFLPDPLALGIAFFDTQGGAGDACPEPLLRVLRDLCYVNNIAREICLVYDRTRQS
ncbi:hypothetical protein F5Y19DRAFT_30429 [Xylariaceae sp. FL1651]|nr:hypothetical protein F5Y19DRAFT_30429 [Xylariaceae sp. FL1651]